MSLAPVWPWHRGRLTLRQVRLSTGIVLFAYVLSHLANHALGNVSFAAMEGGLGLVSAIWLNPIGLVLLYSASLVHLLLGLYALYERRYFGWRPSEIAQLLSGLTIPALLLTHIVGTRVAFSAAGLDKGYAQVLYGLWTASPGYGAMQAAVLLLAWMHGCLGLYFWLRLKRGFRPASPLLLSLAVLVPVLALLGFAQGGRSVALLAQDPVWRAQALAPAHIGLPEQGARLTAIRNTLLAAYGAAIMLALCGRGVRTLMEVQRGLVRLSYPDGRVVRVPSGTSVLEASQRHGIPHASVCGGRGRCSTCRVRVIDNGHRHPIPGPAAAEQVVLDRIGAAPGVRLACQLRPTCDLGVAPLFPPHPRRQRERQHERAQSGEERFVVAMFVDLRGSTRLAEERLPYDTVFIINRFLSAVGQAVREAGGSANQFLGDGMLALFGLESDPATAAQGALRAIDGIAEHVRVLNQLLSADLGQTLRYGIGLHAGTAIVGEMGDDTDARFTALGDTINVASRLQGLTKALECRAVVSQAVYDAAGSGVQVFTEVSIVGRNQRMQVQLIDTVGS